ncbi:hypothetical protein QBC32DRAFT_409474 [Pseudoneurospora amorphoporcata]|uniref:Uncharacterized protein n=1 Tax=Pseudoneurospora amorphoporcata TaxID=241081 RepID=A0AAN6SBG9_9PEZI|nr:hypothetical protein QBC32DRAFT_409474 [Pseudoneurospora amorphoporcata]
MSGRPTGQHVGGLVGARLPDTATRDPGTNTESMTGVEDNDGRKVSAAELRERELRDRAKGKKPEDPIPIVTDKTSAAELRDIINKLSARLLTHHAVRTQGPRPAKIKLNPPPKFDDNHETKTCQMHAHIARVSGS